VQKLPNTPLYAITDSNLVPTGHLTAAKALIAGGARLIQLREKVAGTADFFAAACAVVAYAHQHAVTVIINDRVDIARLSGADGVHLGQEDLSIEKARALLGDSAIIGISTHSLLQAQLANRQMVDYIAVGPIFATNTKPEASQRVTGGQVGLSLLRQIRCITDKPLVAIGGITRQNAWAVQQAGANYVAVIGDLLKTDDIMSRTMEFLTIGLSSESKPS
jgi:thiamine-phosphate pyrophosphorylase